LTLGRGASDNGAMTLHLPRLPISLDPLFGEAKRRTRKRRVLVGVAAFSLAGAATALALALLPSGTSTPSGFVSGGSVSVGRLTVTVPRGFNRHEIRGGFYKVGTRPPVIGQILTDYRVSAHSLLYKGGNFPESGPASGVLFEVQLWLRLYRSTRLHLPLSLDEQWFRTSLPEGTRLWGLLSDGRPGHIPYVLVLWIGRDAPASDRAALLHALAAIHRTH
jgi:hypothetical protein